MDTPPTTDGREANSAAEQLTGRDYLSWSQIELMRRCPRKFACTYVEGRRGDFVPSSLVFGGALHAGLERLMQGRLEGEQVTEAELIEHFKAAWAEAVAEADVPVRFAQGEDRASLHELAGRMFSAFLASPVLERIGTVYAVEQTLRQRLADDLPDLVARIDAAWAEDGRLVVADFKTARSRWSEAKVAESADQLLLYHRMSRDLAAELELPAALRFVILTKAKQPSVQALDVSVDAGDGQRLVQMIRPIWLAMRAGHFYPIPSPMNCSTCPFQRTCPARGARVTVSMPGDTGNATGPD